MLLVPMILFYSMAMAACVELLLSCGVQQLGLQRQRLPVFGRVRTQIPPVLRRADNELCRPVRSITCSGHGTVDYNGAWCVLHLCVCSCCNPADCRFEFSTCSGNFGGTACDQCKPNYFSYATDCLTCKFRLG